MATMDIIKLYGLEPANFLDVGAARPRRRWRRPSRSSSPTQREGHPGQHLAASCAATSSPRRGGRGQGDGDHGAAGGAAGGTNVDLGKQILAQSGLKIVPADNLADAAKKITE